MNGKIKCELLKTIRKSIADLNGIKYNPKPCTHKGDCPGSCPQCEKEADWLMQELRRKEAAGSPIQIDTESLMMLDHNFGDVEDISEEPGVTMGMPNYEPPRLMGSIPAPGFKRKEVDKPEEVEFDIEESFHSVCKGCIRYETIQKTEEGFRCSCLSPCWFEDNMRKGECTLKKTFEEQERDKEWERRRKGNDSNSPSII